MNTINTDLNAVTYVSVVNELADNFFNSDGEYAPHFGLMSAMCTFYNYCVEESKLNEKITSEMDIVDIVNILTSDDDFVHDFNDALNAPLRKLNFANAYCDAMDIVNTKKSSFGQAIDMLKNAMDKVVEKIAPALTNENLAAMNDIYTKIQNGKPTEYAIVEAFAAYNKSKNDASILEDKQGA